MNMALYMAGLKANARTMMSYAFGMVLYAWLFIWVYPSFAGSHALNTLLQQMPQGLMKVLGYVATMTNVSDFLAGEFYSLLYLIIMAIYAIFVATKLVAHVVDNGSMAYLLATPVSRAKVVATQAVVLVSGLTLIGLFTTAGALLGAHWFVRNSGMEAVRFVELNVVGVLLFSVVAGYCFVFSCLARDERSALGLSTVLTIVFYALHLVGDLSNRFAWMNHLSIFTVFDAKRLLHGQGHFAMDAISLGIAAIILFGVAIVGFRKRQLAL